MIQLLPFHTQFLNAWKLFLNRWGVAVVLQLPMLIPALLMYPLIFEFDRAIYNGDNAQYIFQLSENTPNFLLGLVLLVLLSVFVSTATGILFAAQTKLSLGSVVVSTISRYVPVLYTSVLSALAVVVALIPAYLLNLWYSAFASKGAPVDGSALLAVDAIVLIAIVALIIPAVIVMSWVMYAPLAVALKAAPAGFTAMMYTKQLVHYHVWQLVLRMIGSFFLFNIISSTVRSLPYASFLVPFVLSIIIMAFFVEIYRELQQGNRQE